MDMRLSYFLRISRVALVTMLVIWVVVVIVKYDYHYPRLSSLPTRHINDIINCIDDNDHNDHNDEVYSNQDYTASSSHITTNAITSTSVSSSSPSSGGLHSDKNQSDVGVSDDLTSRCRPRHHLAFVKVHKAASTTVANVIQRYGFTRGLNFALPNKPQRSYAYNYLSRPETGPLTLTSVMALPQGQHFDLLWNHAVYNREQFGAVMPGDTVYVAIVREPFQQFVSAFTYYRRGTLKIFEQQKNGNEAGIVTNDNENEGGILTKDNETEGGFLTEDKENEVGISAKDNSADDKSENKRENAKELNNAGNLEDVKKRLASKFPSLTTDATEAWHEGDANVVADFNGGDSEHVFHNGGRANDGILENENSVHGDRRPIANKSSSSNDSVSNSSNNGISNINSSNNNSNSLNDNNSNRNINDNTVNNNNKHNNDDDDDNNNDTDSNNSNPLVQFIEEKVKKKHPRSLLTYFRNKQSLDLGMEPRHVMNHTERLQYIQQLDRDFDLVMLVEYFDESLILLRRLMCWDLQDVIYVYKNRNSREYSFTFSDQDLETHRLMSAADYDLYEFFKRRFLREVSALGQDFRDETAHFKATLSNVGPYCLTIFRQYLKDNNSTFNITNILNSWTDSEMNHTSADKTLIVPASRWNEEFAVTPSTCLLMYMPELDFLDMLFKDALNRGFRFHEKVG